MNGAALAPGARTRFYARLRMSVLATLSALAIAVCASVPAALAYWTMSGAARISVSAATVAPPTNFRCTQTATPITKVTVRWDTGAVGITGFRLVATSAAPNWVAFDQTLSASLGYQDFTYDQGSLTNGQVNPVQFQLYALRGTWSSVAATTTATASYGGLGILNGQQIVIPRSLRC